jgi:Domain of unknown function (DUF4277)
MGGMSRTGRERERARAEIAVVRVLEKRLGALPVVAEFGRRLRIAEIVDELCPVRPLAWVTHGEVIEALAANRLTAPAPLLRVADWAAAMAVEEAYGIAPQLLNDDRIARALDAIAPQLDEIVGGVGAAAVTEFGVDVSRLHWDLTSISLYGAYPEADLEYPAPRWGQNGMWNKRRAACAPNSAPIAIHPIADRAWIMPGTTMPLPNGSRASGTCPVPVSGPQLDRYATGRDPSTMPRPSAVRLRAADRPSSGPSAPMNTALISRFGDSHVANMRRAVPYRPDPGTGRIPADSRC